MLSPVYRVHSLELIYIFLLWLKSCKKVVFVVAEVWDTAVLGNRLTRWKHQGWSQDDLPSCFLFNLHFVPHKESMWIQCISLIFIHIILGIKLCPALGGSVCFFNNRVREVWVLEVQGLKASVFTILGFSSLSKTASQRRNHSPVWWNWECLPWQRTC